MSEMEQAGTYQKLREEAAAIKTQLAKVEGQIRDDGKVLVMVGNYLINRPDTPQNWPAINTLTSDLPTKISYYIELQEEKADMDIQMNKVQPAKIPA